MKTIPATILILAAMLFIGKTSFAQQVRNVSSVNWPTDALKIEIAKDKLADTSTHTIITCSINGVEVNGMMLPKTLSAKYKKIIEEQTGASVKKKDELITLNLNNPYAGKNTK